VVIRRIHHAGIVVKRLADACRFYRDVLGLPVMREADIPEQGVRAALLAAGDSEIELLEPIGPGGVARFLERRGEGLHHLCLDTPDVAGDLAELGKKGVELIDPAPRDGLAGRIAFLHPRALDGVLVELATPPSGQYRVPRAPLRLKRLVIGAREPAKTSGRFQSLFGLCELTINGGPRSMLGVGRGTLLIVPTDEVGGTEGLVALSLISEDFPALTRTLDLAAVKVLRGTGEVTVEPESSHGVHLHISRYE
jgi:methylmalonyl-CoA/ethylmalonyl-CoA epimerase